MTYLKSKTVITHDAWKAAGRPRSGPIFNEKMLIKREYQNKIKLRKKNSSDSVSDKLHTLLINKDQNSFWKLWKSNFVQKIKITLRIFKLKAAWIICLQMRLLIITRALMRTQGIDVQQTQMRIRTIFCLRVLSHAVETQFCMIIV